jgi:hypothetical protein
MKIKIVIFMGFLGLYSISGLFAASQSEGGGSNRGTFLSRSGYVIPAEDIKIEGYIAQNDYDYPLPGRGDLNVITAAGVKADNAYVQIGLKGKKTAFAALPPLNITFCIDRSGSMYDIMLWVKDSFYIFIDQVREGDIISLVDMNTQAQTLIPPTQIKNQADRTRFKREVDAIVADGGTDVYAGMLRSYQENEKNYKAGYVNRVVILTDGMHNFGEKVDKDILNLAASYNRKGIDISTVLLGISTATGLMVDVAIEGGGSSRFISDHDEMVKIFQTELDRMLVPAARDLKMRLVLSDGVTFKDTWGYQYYTEGNTIHYYLSTLHNGDYETMLAELSIRNVPRDNILGTFYLDYQDLSSNQKSLGPYQIRLEPSAVNGSGQIADRRVREAEGFLHFARSLIDIADNSVKIRAHEIELREYTDPSSQRDDIIKRITDELTRNLTIVKSLTAYLNEIGGSLGGNKYEKELEILQNYTRMFTNTYNAYENGEV